MTDAATDTLAQTVGVPSVLVRGVRVFHPARDAYLDCCRRLYEQSFVMCADLCGVDYLRHPGRDLPSGVSAERFEVVVQLRSLERTERVTVRLQLPEAAPVAPSLISIYPGCEAMEREAFDMFGIAFEGHPDLTRILMPDDWEGHPLRKDYSPGRVPVQFKEAPGPR